jgi:photosystem II stability/assembly factor-like uncharacterized protein
MVGRYFLGGVIVVTHDRGNSWSRIEVSSTPLTDVASKAFSDLNIVIAVSSTGKVVYSNDASSWSSVSITGPLLAVTIGSNGKLIISGIPFFIANIGPNIDP